MEQCDRCGTETAGGASCPKCGLAPKSEPPCAGCGAQLAYQDATTIKHGHAISVLVLFTLGSSCTFCRLASANTPVLGLLLLLLALGLVVRGVRRVRMLKCPRCGRKRYPREAPDTGGPR